MKKRIFTKEEIDKVIYNYEILGMGRAKAGEEFGISEKLVKRLLEENGVPVRTIQQANRSRYYINEKFFDTQTEDMAYILGLIASDGCVAGNENCIYIELQESDSEILEKINKVLENEREVKHYVTKRDYKNCKIYFFSAYMKNRLKEYKIIPNKTYDPDYGFPSKLERKFYKDYIRGLFDGDGSIKITEHSLTFQIDSSCYDIVFNIRKFFLEDYNIDLGITIQNPTSTNNRTIPLYRIYAYGEEAKKVMNILYDSPSNLFLKRKKEKYLSLC